ncbi:MAG: DUF2865 domain-containing protein [Bradyrhizobium sp.]|nr:DUF2865 domain-containing protein [Bradyrhizobium sp.]
MRFLSCFQRRRRRLARIAAISIAGALVLSPHAVSAQGLFDFLFGGFKQQQRPAQQQQSNFFNDPFGFNAQPAQQPARPAVASSGPAFCVRSCDGRYFPLMRGLASPAQMCQAFCPASPTKVYFGASIDGATAASGERYAESENAFAFRKALRADCTCNGRDPAGLAPIDLALDNSLRPGDVIATTEGLVAYSGKDGSGQSAEFTPIAAYPGLTSEVRAHLNAMKVAPVSAEMIAGDAQAPDAGASVVPAATSAPKALARDKRAEANFPRPRSAD